MRERAARRAVERPALYERSGDAVVCHVCAHACRLAPGQTGACGVRANLDGEVRAANYGRVVAASLDPIEKKPLRHFRPGSRVYTIAAPGCTLACRFCQNWEIALTARRLQMDAVPLRTAEQVVEDALALGAQGVGFSYTEPAVSLEFTLDVMRCARRAGLYTVWHTNGFLTPRSAAAAAERLDAACVDLKAAGDAAYRRLCGGALGPALDTARTFQAAGAWVEVSTPLLAGQNDSDESVAALARLIGETLGPATPWHLLRGHAAYKMAGLPLTTAAQLARAAGIARAAGLQRVYTYA